MENKSLFKEYENIFESEDTQKKEKKEREYLYSPFALQDAIGERDVKKIWIEYQKIILQGIDEEDVIYKIISKVRDMLAINKGATALDLGIKDYPFNKSKKDLKNWKVENLEDFYIKVVSALHLSRSGGDSLEISLEKVVLTLSVR